MGCRAHDFTVRAHPHDIAKLIEQQGRTARSIHTIIAGAASKLKRRYALVIDGAEEAGS